MRFWDTSALVPLLVHEPRTAAVRALIDDDPHITVWWATEVECASAVARQERHGEITTQAAAQAFERLDNLRAWTELQPGESIRRMARRLVRVHPLQAADGFQLAAALEAAEGNPETLPFVSLDERLAGAAEREGFSVIEPAAGER